MIVELHPYPPSENYKIGNATHTLQGIMGYRLVPPNFLFWKIVVVEVLTKALGALS